MPWPVTVTVICNVDPYNVTNVRLYCDVDAWAYLIFCNAGYAPDAQKARVRGIRCQADVLQSSLEAH